MGCRNENPDMSQSYFAGRGRRGRDLGRARMKELAKTIYEKAEENRRATVAIGQQALVVHAHLRFKPSHSEVHAEERGKAP